MELKRCIPLIAEEKRCGSTYESREQLVLLLALVVLNHPIEKELVQTSENQACRPLHQRVRMIQTQIFQLVGFGFVHDAVRQHALREAEQLREVALRSALAVRTGLAAGRVGPFP
jgi:hypothetical protein